MAQAPINVSPTQREREGGGVVREGGNRQTDRHRERLAAYVCGNVSSGANLSAVLCIKFHRALATSGVVYVWI